MAFRASFVEAYESIDPQDGWERDLIEGCWEEFEDAYEEYEEVAPGEYLKVEEKRTKFWKGAEEAVQKLRLADKEKMKEFVTRTESEIEAYEEGHRQGWKDRDAGCRKVDTKNEGGFEGEYEEEQERITKKCHEEVLFSSADEVNKEDQEKMMKKFYEDEERVVVAQTLKNVEEGREDGRDEGRDFQAFSGGAIKDTKGKLPYHLITKEMMDSVALGLECGLKKGYPARNWEKGLPLMEVHMAACLRHLYKFQAGYNWNEEQTKDGETFTTHHLDNAMSHLAMMVTQVKRGRKDLDDRADDYGLAITEEDI